MSSSSSTLMGSNGTGAPGASSSALGLRERAQVSARGRLSPGRWAPRGSGRRGRHLGAGPLAEALRRGDLVHHDLVPDVLERHVPGEGEERQRLEQVLLGERLAFATDGEGVLDHLLQLFERQALGDFLEGHAVAHVLELDQSLGERPLQDERHAARCPVMIRILAARHPESAFHHEGPELGRIEVAHAIVGRIDLEHGLRIAQPFGQRDA